nr:MAG TPA: hypothetical protein [Caudoviricetes sp.]
MWNKSSIAALTTVFTPIVFRRFGDLKSHR